MREKTFIKPPVTEKEVSQINEMIAANPTWYRSKLSVELCHLWNWCDHLGRPKDISCRDMLRDLDAKGLINLPASRKITRRVGSKDIVRTVLHESAEISCDIQGVLPIRVDLVKERTHEGHEYKYLIDQYHYLGFDMTVGENIKYMVYSRDNKLLACLLFGSSAWSCAPRDQYIKWTPSARKANLIHTTNNTRFLVLPWVRIPHLASHILGQITRRIASDWQLKYGHSVQLLETFVEKDRFKGTCYKAANWIYVGETTGRSRNDRYSKMSVPIKDIYLFPLNKRFREVLSDAANT